MVSLRKKRKKKKEKSLHSFESKGSFTVVCMLRWPLTCGVNVNGHDSSARGGGGNPFGGMGGMPGGFGGGGFGGMGGMPGGHGHGHGGAGGSRQQPRKKADPIEQVLKLTLEEMYYGVQKNLKLTRTVYRGNQVGSHSKRRVL